MKWRSTAGRSLPLLALALALVSVTARADSPLDVAQAAWTRGTRTSHRIASLLDEARRIHDPQRTMCLDDALSRTNAQLRVIRQRTEVLQHAAAVHDSAGVAREVRIFRTATQRIREAEVYADACVGILRHAGVDEETTVEVEIAPDVPEYVDLH